jgi:hypothetical protein
MRRRYLNARSTRISLGCVAEQMPAVYSPAAIIRGRHPVRQVAEASQAEAEGDLPADMPVIIEGVRSPQEIARDRRRARLIRFD